MLMEHFLCDDVGGKHNVCGMEITNKKLLITIVIITFLIF
ncbi:MAG: hypothetical protein ACI93N_001404 [Flavobacteriaceae bacterium]|jgi:hypothetical protein